MPIKINWYWYKPWKRHGEKFTQKQGVSKVLLNLLCVLVNNLLCYHFVPPSRGTFWRTLPPDISLHTTIGQNQGHTHYVHNHPDISYCRLFILICTLLQRIFCFCDWVCRGWSIYTKWYKSHRCSYFILILRFTFWWCPTSVIDLPTDTYKYQVHTIYVQNFPVTNYHRVCITICALLGSISYFCDWFNRGCIRVY